MKFTVLITLLLFLIVNTGFAQITYESADNGVYDWYAVSTWTRLPLSETWAPATPGNPTNSNCNAITVSGYVRVESGGLTVNNANPVITVNDTLYIVGNVTLGSGASLNVAANGILIVTGNLTLEGSFDIANGGNIVVGGNLNVTNGTIQNNEDFYVFGTTSVSGGGTVNGCDGYGNPGGCNPTSAGGIGDETDLQNNNPDLADFVAGGGVLPVELIFFNCVQNGDKVLMQWATASQLNFSHFDLEHSMNAQEWSTLTSIEGEGTTNDLKEYFYTHTRPHNGKNYYRLRMVDLDETFEYSDIVSANVNANNAVSLSPNPTNGNIVRYTINFTPEEGDQLVVYNLMGGLVHATQVLSFTGELNLPSSLVRGTYLVRYKGQTVNQVIRLVVE